MAEFIDLVGPKGERKQVEASGLNYALSRGFRELTDEDRRREFVEDTKKEIYDTPTGKIVAGTAGALDMLTFGASGAAIKNLAPETAQVIADAQAENPKTSMAGSGAGLLTGLGAAKGAFNTISRTGQAVGKGAQAMGAGKGLAKVAQYGTEGALISLPKAGTELITGTPEEAAETLMYGTAIGGGFGGVTGVLPGFVKGITKPVTTTFKPIATRAAQGLENIERSQGGKVLGFTKSIRQKMGQSRADELIEWADKKGFMKVLNSTDDLVSMTNKAREEAGKTLGKVVKEIDSTGKYFANTQEMLDRLQRIRVPQGQLLAPERRAYQKAMSDVVDLVTTPKTGQAKFVKLGKLHDLRKQLDQYTYAEFGQVKPGRDLVKQMRRVVEDIIVDGITAAEKTVPDQARRWLNAKIEYRNYSDLLKPLENKLAGEMGNQLIRPSDMAGAIVGGTTGGVKGAAAGVVLNTLRHEYGAQIAYKGVKGLNNLIRRSDQLIDRSVKKYFQAQSALPTQVREAVKPASFVASSRLLGDRASGTGSRASQVTRVEEALATAIANPAKSAEVLSEVTGNLSQTSPEIAMALQNKVMQAVEYLHQKAPKPTTPTNPLILRQWKPTEREVSSFEKRVKAALEPYSVLQDLQKGQLHKESMDTIKDLYPSFHQKVQSRVMNQITENKKPLSLKQRMHLSIIMGMSLDPLLSQRSMQALQQGYAVQDQQQNQPNRQGRMKSVDGIQSDVQRVTYK